jgi:hypothetical protein
MSAFNVGQYVRITAWGSYNGTPPDLARLPTVMPGRIVTLPRRQRNVDTKIEYGEAAYTVLFPGYGELLVKESELMPLDG